MHWKLVLAVSLALILLAGCNREHEFKGTVYKPAIPAPTLVGAQSDGTSFDLKELGGKVVMLFFGYTSCPDICPLALADMKQVKTQLGAKADDVAVVFVTLDPERDTPERLRTYLNAFDPSFIGVTMSETQLEQAKKDYGVFSEKVVPEASQSAADYLINHTGWTYVIDQKSDLREVFATDVPIADRVEDVGYLAGN